MLPCEKWDMECLGYVLITVVSIIVAIFLQRIYNIHVRKYPPGPIGLPLLGYLPFLGKEPHKVLAKLSKKYGSIFSLYFGPAYTVIISDYEKAKEVLSHPTTSARPKGAFDLLPGKGGFTGGEGDLWQEQRRFFIFCMKNLGLGRGPWEDIIQEDAAELANKLKSYEGKPIDITDYLIRCGTSNTVGLLIGRRLPKKESNPEVQILLDTLRVVLVLAQASSVSVFAPWISKYFVKFRIAGYHRSAKTMQDFSDLFRKEIDLHRNSQDPSHATDFIGLYLAEMKKQEESGKKHYFTTENLVGNMISLFFAGTDTTTSSIRWLLLLMASNPEAQRKVHKELDDTFGRDGQLFWNDRTKLPYTMAAILETQRWVAITPLYPPRRAIESLEIDGLTIPKGSTIIGNNWAIMHDEKYWEKPDEFIPERFLPKPEINTTKFKGYGAFSFGKRNCPGENIAIMTILLFFTAIMQKFTVTAPSGGSVDLTGKFAIVIHPKDQKLCFKER